ncbi:uncharacterized protein LOC144163862 [Haemaphysalis longicornis]
MKPAASCFSIAPSRERDLLSRFQGQQEQIAASLREGIASSSENDTPLHWKISQRVKGLDTLVKVFTDCTRNGENLAISGPDMPQHEKFPRGMKGVDTMVRVIVTRRRYEEILSICGPGFQPEATQILATYRTGATMKIPEARFDEVLRIDTYVRGHITLYLYEPFSPPDKAVDGEVRPIFLNQTDQAFFFFGTVAVFNKLKAWKWACEELSRRVRNQDTLTGAAWRSAGAAARPLHFQKDSKQDFNAYL